jgi:hypothetical protein
MHKTDLQERKAALFAKEITRLLRTERHPKRANIVISPAKEPVWWIQLYSQIRSIHMPSHRVNLTSRCVTHGEC